MSFQVRQSAPQPIGVITSVPECDIAVGAKKTADLPCGVGVIDDEILGNEVADRASAALSGKQGGVFLRGDGRTMVEIVRWAASPPSETMLCPPPPHGLAELLPDFGRQFRSCTHRADLSEQCVC